MCKLCIKVLFIYFRCQETIKPIMKAEDLSSNPAAVSSRSSALAVLYTCLDNGLRLLHPFMPFITEELYHRLPGFGRDNPEYKLGTGGKNNCGSIMVAPYPDIKSMYEFR